MLLSWEKLSCVFGGRTVFKDFSGAVDAGERVRITGPSGCGKSSFLSMLMGFLAPSSGVILLDGQPLGDIPPPRLRAAMTMVPQEPDFGTDGTVRDALLRPFSYRLNRACRPTEAALAARCRRFALPDGVLDAAVTSLSGGEKQRVAGLIAGLLPRRLLLLDEPFSALDAGTAATLAAAFREKTARAIVYVTHTDAAPAFATREIDLEACHG